MTKPTRELYDQIRRLEQIGRELRSIALRLKSLVPAAILSPGDRKTLDAAWIEVVSVVRGLEARRAEARESLAVKRAAPQARFGQEGEGQ